MRARVVEAFSRGSSWQETMDVGVQSVEELVEGLKDTLEDMNFQVDDSRPENFRSRHAGDVRNPFGAGKQLFIYDKKRDNNIKWQYFWVVALMAKDIEDRINYWDGLLQGGFKWASDDDLKFAKTDSWVNNNKGGYISKKNYPDFPVGKPLTADDPWIKKVDMRVEAGNRIGAENLELMKAAKGKSGYFYKTMKVVNKSQVPNWTFTTNLADVTNSVMKWRFPTGFGKSPDRILKKELQKIEDEREYHVRRAVNDVTWEKGSYERTIERYDEEVKDAKEEYEKAVERARERMEEKIQAWGEKKKRAEEELPAMDDKIKQAEIDANKEIDDKIENMRQKIMASWEQYTRASGKTNESFESFFSKSLH